jgi:hypothetical protein
MTSPFARSVENEAKQGAVSRKLRGNIFMLCHTTSTSLAILMGENVILQVMAGAGHTQFPYTHHKSLRANFTAQRPIKKAVRIKKEKQNTYQQNAKT